MNLSITQKLFQTKRGTIVVASLFAIIACALILSYLSQARKSASSGGAAAKVLTAKVKIPKGTLATAILSGGYYKISQVRHDQLQAGAIASPEDISGAATKDLFPGQQLTKANFGSTPTTMLSNLSKNERAITVSLDQAHGMVGSIQSNSRVDVFAGFQTTSSTGQSKPVLKLIGQNILVLQAPDKNSVSTGGSVPVVLRAENGTQAAKLAFASDNGKLWLILRPPGATDTIPPSAIDVNSVLDGSQPISGGK